MFLFYFFRCFDFTVSNGKLMNRLQVSWIWKLKKDTLHVDALKHVKTDMLCKKVVPGIMKLLSLWL
jgi:hypothetical protein